MLGLFGPWLLACLLGTVECDDGAEMGSAAPPEASSPPVGFHADMVVVAQRAGEPLHAAAAAVTVLDRDAIARAPAENLAELLELVPGMRALFAVGFGGLPMVGSRGFFGGGEAEYVKLLVDGLPAADAESGIADWKGVRAADVDRVEVLRDPGALYGDTALGGVVQVFTRRPGSDPGARVGVSAGSFGSLGGDLSVDATPGELAARLTARGAHTDGFRRNSRAAEAGATLRVMGRDRGSSSLRLTADGTWRQRQEPGPLSMTELAVDRFGSNPLFDDDLEESRRTGVAWSWYRQGATAIEAHGAARDRHTELRRTLLVAPGVGDATVRRLDGQSLDGLVLLDRGFARAGEPRLRGGVEVSRARIDTRYFTAAPEGGRGAPLAAGAGRRQATGLFAGGDFGLPRLRLSAGARWDLLEDCFGQAICRRHRAWSPRLGASVALGRQGARSAALFFQAVEAFKAPTLDQLFDPRSFALPGAPPFLVSNPDLGPQRSRTLELGVRAATQRHRATVVAYRTEVDNEIDFDPLTFRYQNVGETLHRGLELDAELFADRRWSLPVGYAWTRVAPREERGTQLKNLPEHVVRLGVNGELVAGIHGALWLHRVTGWYLDDANRYPGGSATRVDLRLRRSFGPLDVRVDVLNALGHQHLLVGYVLQDFQGRQVPHGFPGHPRAVRLGLEWRSRRRRRRPVP